MRSGMSRLVILLLLGACAPQNINQQVQVGISPELVDRLANKSPQPVASPVASPSPTPAPVLEAEVSNNLGMTFKRVPAGAFVMGSEPSEVGHDTDETTHAVTLTAAYYLQTTEVTQAQWEAVMKTNPSRYRGANLPVESVSWLEVQDFISALNQQGQGTYRLPTEAEWEYAARAGTTTPYACGFSEACLQNSAWYAANAEGQPHPVGQKPANAWGFHDMHGNVWEWVSDWYGPYPDGATVDPQGPSTGTYRVNRGSSWDGPAANARIANRGFSRPDAKGVGLGFRLVRLP